MEITQELARTVGHLYGDGCLDKSGKMYYINKNDVLISNFIKDVQTIFGNNVHYCIYTRPDGVKRVYIEKRVAGYLKEVFEELKSRVKIPKIIKNSIRLVISNFLQAMFDDDGGLLWDKKSSCRLVCISLKNKKILSEIREMLFEIGIKPNEIMKVNTNYSGYMWRMTISNQNNLEKFAKEIDFSHPRKHSKLRMMLKAFQQPHRKKKDTINIIIKELNQTPLTIPEIQNLIKRSETQTRRVVKELHHLGIINTSSRKIIYDKLDRKKLVNLWSVNNNWTKNGKSLREISEELEIPYSTIKVWIRGLHKPI